jgi:hypothetical protein
VAVVAAIVLLVEAVGIVAINGVLATFVERQSMSVADLDSDAMVTGTWAMGVVLGLYFAACGVVLLLTGARDRAPGRVARILLISCAIMHGVLGALTVGLVGWNAFAFMMVVLGLIVLMLVAYGSQAPREDEHPSGRGNDDQPDAAPTPGAATA